MKNKIIIMNRDNIDINKYTANYPNANFIIINDFKMNISSTEIRNNKSSKIVTEEY